MGETVVETTLCPKCKSVMHFVTRSPHPIAHGMMRHTYLCEKCNQTKTYMLPKSETLQASQRAPEGRDGGR